LPPTGTARRLGLTVRPTELERVVYVLSRKMKASIERRLADIGDGVFTESTVKELMIDLRELARQSSIVGQVF
jgi:hypothetical protein